MTTTTPPAALIPLRRLLGWVAGHRQLTRRACAGGSGALAGQPVSMVSSTRVRVVPASRP
jgi:hypothetical protein